MHHLYQFNFTFKPQQRKLFLCVLNTSLKHFSISKAFAAFISFRSTEHCLLIYYTCNQFHFPHDCFYQHKYTYPQKSLMIIILVHCGAAAHHFDLFYTFIAHGAQYKKISFIPYI